MQTKSSGYFKFNPLRFSLPPKKAVPEERRSLIAQEAYYRAERRHFEPGHELEDWLAAESEVDRRIAQARWREQDSLVGRRSDPG